MNYSINLKQKSGKILRGLTSLFLTIFSLTLFSCSSSDPYPDKWGYVMDVQKHGDSVISGNYNIYGKCTYQRDSCSIFRVINLPGFTFKRDDFDNISFNLLNKDSLLVLVRAKSDTIYKTVYPGNGFDFSLSEDGLEMEPRKNKGGDLGFVLPLFTSDNLTLMKGADSSLIVKYSGWGIGLLYPGIPLYGSVSNWYKFPQYKLNNE